MKIENVGGHAKKAGDGVLASIHEGLLYVWNDATLKIVFPITMGLNVLINGPFAVGVPVVARTRFPEGAAAFGLIMSVFGGGALLVPIMSLVMLMPIHAVVATSMFTMIFTSLSGVAQHYTLGNIDFAYALLLIVGAIVGAQLGAWLSKKISGATLRIIFAVVLIIVSVQMIIKFI